jgi:hypothetical protein
VPALRFKQHVSNAAHPIGAFSTPHAVTDLSFVASTMGNHTSNAAVFGDLIRYLSLAERRYEHAETQLKLEVWRRIRGRIQDPFRELHNFHDAMRQKPPVPRCAEQVMLALGHSGARAEMLAKQQLTGLDLGKLWPALWPTLQEAAIYSGGGAVLGAVVGAAPGACSVGVSVVSGRSGGAGSGAGACLLGRLGIPSLVEHISAAIPETVDAYSRGFALAWHAGELDPRYAQGLYTRSQSATNALAQGHVLLVTALLSAILRQHSQGANSRARLYAEIERSKPGPSLAQWIDANADSLMQQPALRPVVTEAGSRY